MIPSREDILKLNIPKAPVYSPDLSYLKKAPHNSLAGRLAKPKIQPKDVSALTEKRRLERLAREEKEAELSAKRIEESLARDAKKAQNFNDTIRTFQDNADKLNSLGPLLNSPGPLPLAQSAMKPPAERPDDELSPSALKRREERRLRETSVKQDRQLPRKKRERSWNSQSGSMKFETATTENLDSVDSAELEAASPTVHAPEFNGPESISETIDDFNNFGVVQVAHPPSAHGQHSIKISESSTHYHLNPNIIDSLAGGDYSAYTSLSPTTNSTSTSALTVVNTAELALFHQRDYIIPQRKRAIEIVKTLVGANFVQAPKGSQAVS